MKKVFIILAAVLFIISGQAVAQERELIDYILAVVGDKVITASEVANQLQMYYLNTGVRPSSQYEVDSLQQAVIDQLISDQLFLLAAQDDTSIIVRDEEVDMALEDHIARLAGNFESNDAFLAALNQEGMNLRDFKREYRDDIRNQLMKQQYIQRKLYSVSISRHEVEEFYRKFKDSIPSQPETVKLAHLLVKIMPSQEVEDSLKTIATDLRQKVLSGADFATISSRYSGGGAGKNGGDLGLVSKEDLIPELSRPAFNLESGDISGVIRSPLGYHILKCDGKRGEKIRLRHIYLPVFPSAQDTVAAYNLTDSLLQEARSGADFRELAKTFSDDNNTRAEGGELGWFAVQDMPVEYINTVRGWTTPGEYRGPVSSSRGYHVLKLIDYNPEKKITLETDYDQIKEMARQDKTGRMVDKWIEELKEKTFIDLRLRGQN